MSRNQALAVALVAIVAALAGALLARGSLSNRTLPQAAMSAGTLVQPPRPLPDIALVDHAGRAFTRDQLRDHWTFMFFGFTNCPDVCPATLGTLAQIERTLQDLPEPERPQVVLVSVDPERDGPAQLAQYVRFFSPSFIGVTGSKDGIEAFTRAMGVPVAISTSSSGAYTVDHSASIFLIDPQASFRALFSMPHEPDKIAADYRLIARH